MDCREPEHSQVVHEHDLRPQVNCIDEAAHELQLHTQHTLFNQFQHCSSAWITHTRQPQKNSNPQAIHESTPDILSLHKLTTNI